LNDPSKNKPSHRSSKLNLSVKDLSHQHNVVQRSLEANLPITRLNMTRPTTDSTNRLPNIEAEEEQETRFQPWKEALAKSQQDGNKGKEDVVKASAEDESMVGMVGAA
jgi:hypothetical protein